MQLEIVYLDDEPDLIDLFQEMFSSAKVKVTVFSSADEIVQYVESHKVDIVFLDYRLPSTTGDEVALRMPPQIPKALISGDLQLAPTAHFEAIFSKPYEMQKIRAFIDSKASKS